MHDNLHDAGALPALALLAVNVSNTGDLSGWQDCFHGWSNDETPSSKKSPKKTLPPVVALTAQSDGEMGLPNSGG